MDLYFCTSKASKAESQVKPGRTWRALVKAQFSCSFFAALASAKSETLPVLNSALNCGGGVRQCLYFCTSKASKMSSVRAVRDAPRLEQRVELHAPLQVRQYLCFCTSKASKLSSVRTVRGAPRLEARVQNYTQRRRCVSICTFVPVRQVNSAKSAFKTTLSAAGASVGVSTCTLVKQDLLY